MAYPRVGCGAWIQDSDSRVLLVKRLREPEAAHWGIPGGKLDLFETLEACTTREILEELGVSIAIDRLLCVVDQIDEDNGQHWVAPVFLAKIKSGSPTIMEPEALSQWAWFDVSALPEPLTAATRRSLMLVLKLN